jgi:NADH-quinone oxidoreductase subunit F
MTEDSGLALDEESLEEKPRAKLILEKPETRKRDFREVEKGLEKDQAWYEAMRCLRCDLERDMRGE